MASVVLAALALAVSLASFVVNHRASALAERRGRMPVLVFRERTGSKLVLENVGNGPAMNIIFAQGRTNDSSADPISLSKGIHEPWFNPIHLTPVPPHETLDVPWDTGDGLGLSYTDALGKVYTVKASDYGMVALEGLHLPDWGTREAKYVSQLGDARPEGPHWGERQPVRRRGIRLRRPWHP
jgi:hypothetical protein